MLYQFSDDPYYSGLSARSTFAQQQKSKDRQQQELGRGGHYPYVYMQGHHGHLRAMFQSRSFDSGMGN